jgi:hypothetical protein
MPFRMLATVTCSLALSACASTFSSDMKYWNEIAQGPLSKEYGEWASCINGSIGSGGTFAEVLSRCDGKKSHHWSTLSYEEERRVIDAAWFAYKSEEYRRNSDEEQSII